MLPSFPIFWKGWKVASVGAEVLVGGVDPRGDEGGLCCHPSSIGNYGPRSEVCNEKQDGFVAVPKVVHLLFFGVLGNDGGDNCRSPVEDDGFLEVIFIPGHLMLVGELLILGNGGQGSDVRVREVRLLHLVSVERRVVGDVAHLGLLKDEG